MSVYSKNSQKSAAAAASSKYCDVCYGAGKTFAEYTSHFVKSKVGPDGVVTCPTILNSICTYCKTKGHFKSACEVLKAKNARTARTAAAATVTAVTAVKTCIKKRQRNGDMITKNTFDCLREEEDDDDNNTDYPLMMSSVVMKTNPSNIIPVKAFESSVMGSRSGSSKMSYAQALESAAKTFQAACANNSKDASLSLPPLVEVNASSSSNSLGNALLAYVTNTVPPLITLRRSSAFNVNGTRKSWADYDSDSSEGEDEDDE